MPSPTIAPAPVPCPAGRPAGGLAIIVPFHRHEELVHPLVESLLVCRDEFNSLDAIVLAINDSPGHAPLAEALAEAESRCRGAIRFEIVTNPENIGFLRSANRGMERAVAAGRDVLLLNSDTVVFPGAITEMVRVAGLDPMIGFVSPRSNNATIASLPVQESLRHRSAEESFRDHARLAGHLPAFHYVPTAIGFCLLVKQRMLAEFGLFDEAYGAGYNEENDLVMRANRCGYRAVLANRAFVYHRGETSFGTATRRGLEQENARRLAGRYPEYPRVVAAYESGPVHRAERMLSAILPDREGRHGLVFDCSDVGSYHNGTIEAATLLLRGFAARHGGRYRLAVIIHAEHARFHGLDRIAGVEVLPVDTDQTFAVGLRVGQPFTRESLLRLNRLAVRTAWFMLDTITWDCMALVNPDLDWIWRQVFAHGDAVIYNSDFTRRQYATRFSAAAGLRHLVSPHSLDPAEYLPAGGRPGRTGGPILVVGNRFPHKHVGPTVDALMRALPRESAVVCVGLDRHPDARVTCLQSGSLSAERMESLYEEAGLIVFPSHYEGFGFPILKALAYRKPIVIRDTDLAREMKAALGNSPNIVLCGTTAELVDTVAQRPPAWIPEPPASRRGWAASVDEIAEVLDGLIARPDAFDPLCRRLGDLAAAAAWPPTAAPADAPLPASLRRLRAWVVRRPLVRRLVQPFWRLAFRLTRS
jgi:GT2 family glycosyltransferase/glycosyltransferase involved in cell wall biosynthesis